MKPPNETQRADDAGAQCRRFNSADSAASEYDISAMRKRKKETVEMDFAFCTRKWVDGY
jgi:hypothetical protein